MTTVKEYVELIRTGQLTSEAWVQTCLDNIDATEHSIHAWAHLDPEYALQQAREMDEVRRAGLPTGPLHGVPIGLKDTLDTTGLPTERGSAIYKGRLADHDAAIVEKLREAGAVILGKTVTTEFAFMDASITCNPHNPAHSPGGSSSGSAAAVAAGHVPLAVGSQTNGSVNRPAGFCGVYGYKPTSGIISRHGLLASAPTLDQPGFFAQHLEDLCLISDVCGGYDARDPLSYLRPRPNTLAGYNAEVPVEPLFAWIDMPYAHRYSDALNAGIEELLDELGDKVDRIPAPQSFEVLIKCHQNIYFYELNQSLAIEEKEHKDKLSPLIVETLEKAKTVSRAEYDESITVMQGAKDWFKQFFNDYDAILTPSALAEAPLLHEGTGDPVCCTIWTLSGLPCLSLPLLTGENDLPLGIQMVAGENEDDRLFRTTRWLMNRLDLA